MVSWPCAVSLVRRRLVLTSLQQTEDGRVSGAETCKVLEVLEDEAGGLLVVVHGQDCDDDNDKGAQVPDQEETGKLMTCVSTIHFASALTMAYLV